MREPVDNDFWFGVWVTGICGLIVLLMFVSEILGLLLKGN